MNGTEQENEQDLLAQQQAEAMGNAQRINQAAPGGPSWLPTTPEEDARIARQRALAAADGTNFQQQQPQQQPGLNVQGQGAVGLPLSAPRQQNRGTFSGLYTPTETMIGQVNPLTGIIDVVHAPMPAPGQQNPWVADQVDKLEQSMDMIRANKDGKYSPQTMAKALQRQQAYLQRIDPQGIYQRGSPLRQMTTGQQWASQNVFKDPETGLVFYNSGRQGWKVHEPKPEKAEAQLPEWGPEALQQGTIQHPAFPGVLFGRDKNGKIYQVHDERQAQQDLAKQKVDAFKDAADTRAKQAQENRDHSSKLAADIGKMAHEIYNSHLHDQEVSEGTDKEGKAIILKKKTEGKSYAEALKMAKEHFRSMGLQVPEDAPPPSSPFVPWAPPANPLVPKVEDSRKRIAGEAVPAAPQASAPDTEASGPLHLGVS